MDSQSPKKSKHRAARSGAWALNETPSVSTDSSDLHNPRRIRIAEATAADIELHGLERTSLKTISRRLNLTTGAIQHYFVSKETLLEFTKRHYLSRLLSNATEAYHGAATGKLLTLCEMIIPLTPDRLLAWKVLIAFSGKVIGDSALTLAQIGLYSGSVELFSNAIASEFVTDRQRHIDAWTEAVGLISFLEGLAIHMVFSTDGYKRAQPLRLVARYLDVCLGSQWPTEPSERGTRRDIPSARKSQAKKLKEKTQAAGNRF